MSVDFMVGIIEERFWCPKTNIIEVRNCAQPPDKLTIAKALVAQMAKSVEKINVEMKQAFMATRERIAQTPPSS